MTTDIENKIIEKLNMQEKEEGKLPLLFNFYRRLLQVQSEVKRQIDLPKPLLSREAINQRLEQGLPLVSFDNFTADWSLLRDTFGKVASVFAEFPELFSEAPERLKEPDADNFLTKEVVKAWLEGQKLPVTMVESTDNEKLLPAIIQASLRPFLQNYARALISCVNQERWRRRYCPICGGNPDFAFLDKERGARWLSCSRCDAEWLFQRLECPYCGNQNQSTLAYFTDDKGMYRLYVCEKCKHYLKAMDLRPFEAEVLLPLERLYTLDLDAQAHKQGYHPYDKAIE